MQGSNKISCRSSNTFANCHSWQLQHSAVFPRSPVLWQLCHSITPLCGCSPPRHCCLLHKPCASIFKSLARKRGFTQFTTYTFMKWWQTWEHQVLPTLPSTGEPPALKGGTWESCHQHCLRWQLPRHGQEMPRDTKSCYSSPVWSNSGVFPPRFCTPGEIMPILARALYGTSWEAQRYWLSVILPIHRDQPSPAFSIANYCNFNPIVFLVSLNHRTSPAGKHAVQIRPGGDLCTSNCCYREKNAERRKLNFNLSPPCWCECLHCLNPTHGRQ